MKPLSQNPSNSTPLSEQELRKKIEQTLAKYFWNEGNLLGESSRKDKPHAATLAITQLLLQDRKAWCEYVIGKDAESNHYHICKDIIIDWDYTGSGDYGYGKCGECGMLLSGFTVTEKDRRERQRNQGEKSDA